MAYGMLQRWRKSTRTAVVEDPGGSDRRVFDVADIERGWVVRDGAGRRIGSVDRVTDREVVVRRGLLSARVVVPITTIAEVHEGRLDLTATLARLLDSGRGHVG